MRKVFYTILGAPMFIVALVLWAVMYVAFTVIDAVIVNPVLKLREIRNGGYQVIFDTIYDRWMDYRERHWYRRYGRRFH